eukprot:Rmarinus@m.18350
MRLPRQLLRSVGLLFLVAGVILLPVQLASLPRVRRALNRCRLHSSLLCPLQSCFLRQGCGRVSLGLLVCSLCLWRIDLCRAQLARQAASALPNISVLQFLSACFQARKSSQSRCLTPGVLSRWVPRVSLLKATTTHKLYISTCALIHPLPPT